MYLWFAWTSIYQLLWQDTKPCQGQHGHCRKFFIFCGNKIWVFRLGSLYLGSSDDTNIRNPLSSTILVGCMSRAIISTKTLFSALKRLESAKIYLRDSRIIQAYMLFHTFSWNKSKKKAKDITGINLLKLTCIWCWASKHSAILETSR